MTTTETTGPWGPLPPQPSPIVRTMQNLGAAWKTMRCGEGSLRERWDVVDYYLAPNWLWLLRRWISNHITHRDAYEREKQEIRRLNQLDEQAQTDKAFWSIVANG